jgi:hypothetical protein
MAGSLGPDSFNKRSAIFRVPRRLTVWRLAIPVLIFKGPTISASSFKVPQRSASRERRKQACWLMKWLGWITR